MANVRNKIEIIINNKLTLLADEKSHKRGKKKDNLFFLQYWESGTIFTAVLGNCNALISINLSSKLTTSVDPNFTDSLPDSSCTCKYYIISKYLKILHYLQKTILKIVCHYWKYV